MLTARTKLPARARILLFGDRDRYGPRAEPHDPDWLEWQRVLMQFYRDTQRRGAGRRVCDAGYRVLRGVDLNGRRVLEVGPGLLPHMPFWRGRPDGYWLVDINSEMIDQARQMLVTHGIAATTSSSLPPEHSIAGTFGVIIAFFCLEHLYPLGLYLDEMERLLEPRGLLVGAIPTEGGLAWGLGRLLTTRRYLRKRTSLDPGKIICWEHPNFADTVLRMLDERFERVRVEYRPAGVPLIDVNLIVRFVYRRRS